MNVCQEPETTVRLKTYETRSKEIRRMKGIQIDCEKREGRLIIINEL